MVCKFATRLLIPITIWASLIDLSARIAYGQSKGASPVERKQERASSDKSSGSKTQAAVSATGKNEAALRRRALYLLPQLLEQAQTFEENERARALKRLLIQIEIADLLWNNDQSRARQLFTDAFNAADSMRADSLSHDMRLRLRNQILSYLIKYDKALAEKLAASVANNSQKFSNDESLKEQATLYLQAAMSYTDSNPGRAARLIRNSLNGWFDYKHLEALRSLRNRSPALADQIFIHALSIIPNNPVHLTSRIALLTAYVFPNIEQQWNIVTGQKQDLKVTAINNPELVRSFLDFIYNTFFQQPLDALASESGETDMQRFDHKVLREMESYFDQYMPDKSASIRERIEEVIREIKRTDKRNVWSSMAEDRAKDFSGSVQEWSDQAEKAKDQTEKDRCYLQAAALLAMRDQNFEQAMVFVSKVSNERKRRESVLTIALIAAGMALMKGDVEKACSYIKDIPESNERVRLLALIANGFAAKKENDKAKGFLKEAEQSVSKMDDSSEKVKALILIADIAAVIDSDLGFAAMQSAIEADNRIDFPSENEGYNVSDGKVIIIGMSRFDNNQSFSWLVRANFERALSLAKQIADREASVVAQLAVCRGILNKSTAPRPIDMRRMR